MSDSPNKRPVLNKRRLAAIILGILIVCLLLGLFRFIRHRLEHALTNAVFVASDSLTEVGFDRVGGVVQELSHKEGEEVAAGELLARIDPQPYRLEEQKLNAALQTAEQNHAALQLQRTRIQQQLALKTALAGEEIQRIERQKQAADAQVARLQAQIDQLQRDLRRMTNLFAEQAVPRQRLEQISSRLDGARAEQLALRRARQALDPAHNAAQLQLQLAQTEQQQLLELDRKLAAALAECTRLQSNLDKARRDLANTELKSPLSGRIAKRFVNRGGNIAPGQPVMALVDPKDIYIIALLEENKLAGVSQGSVAKIRIDAYSDRTWQGEVERVLPASAATFALAPRDISAGEFTKVAQRIPVRIRITDGPLELLRIGLGGEVEIRRKEH